VPETAAEAKTWFQVIEQLLSRKKGFDVVASMSNLAFSPDQMLEGEEPGQQQGELTVVLTRKLGMAITKLGQEIVIAKLEHDGAAAACGLLSEGDAILKVNGEEATGGCKQTIKMLTKNPTAVQLQLISKVVHGGWMHKLGEGLGGWTTRYFTLAYELDAATATVVKKDRPRAASLAPESDSASLLVRLHKANQYDKLGVGLIEDANGQVVISRIYPGYVAQLSNLLLPGDILLAVNGEPVADQESALKLLTGSVGTVELRLVRSQDPGCWVLRYYDGKNSVVRKEKGVIRLDRDSVREINSYTLQEDTETEEGVPRIGLYVLQDERCWELLPPEEELLLWISKLQLAVWGQEVISADYCNASRAEAAKDKVVALKGPRNLKLQQQYGLVLATYDKPPQGAQPAPEGVQGVYVKGFEMDGAAACSGMLSPTDRVLEVDGVEAEGLKQVTAAIRGGSHQVKVKVASKVVHGGFMRKKGEVNTEYQLRFFLLIDEGTHSILRYFEGQNAVTRVAKGEIRISPKDVRSVRQFSGDDSRTGDKTHGIIINTLKEDRVFGRSYELQCKTLAEARLWYQLLIARVRKGASEGRDRATTEAPTVGTHSVKADVRERAVSELGDMPRNITTRL
jgi:C-terminal processing protease CtpA/Prc